MEQLKVKIGEADEIWTFGWYGATPLEVAFKGDVHAIMRFSFDSRVGSAVLAGMGGVCIMPAPKSPQPPFTKGGSSRLVSSIRKGSELIL